MKRFFFFLTSCLLIIGILYCVLFIRPYRVLGDSMAPMLQNNTLILLDTLQARIGTIQRGNIIVYIHEDRTPKIKRVLGIEKEVLVIRDGGIYLNEKKISEPYLNQNIRTCVPGSCTDLSPKIFTVPKNAYFILGDNRENSRDSR